MKVGHSEMCDGVTLLSGNHATVASLVNCGALKKHCAAGLHEYRKNLTFGFASGLKNYVIR